MFDIDYKYHSVSEWESISHDAFVNSLKKGNGYYYFDVPCAFDIETSSFYIDDKKQGCMYVWQFGINGHCIVGRTWSDFLDLMENLEYYLGLNLGQRLIVYVHNLSYEFQWIHDYFEWDTVFCLDNRKPIYARTKTGIEFRCSYLLSGYSLEKLGENLTKYKVKKMVGDLDYKLIRTPKTPLSDKEMQYCINDVLVVMAYIQECKDVEKCIGNIPLTKTGYVRRYCRKNCLGNYKRSKNRNNKYLSMIECLQITGIDEFKALQRAFSGGFTHANVWWSNRICNDVSSFDFTSSYPTVMIAEKFPMSSAKKITVNSLSEMDSLLNSYCCLFDIIFHGIRCKTINDNPISVSKCYARDNVSANNGRVVSADRIATTLTDVDFEIIKAFYDWDSIEIGDFWIYERGYLPKELVSCVLKLYTDKTTLKGVAGKEVEYMRGKSMLNSVYGMCVTNPLREEFTFTYEWIHKDKDYKEGLDEYNNDSKRFLFYPWGVWVTAYARRNLFSGIANFGIDYIYADTDSIKCFNKEKHMNYINWYNGEIIKKLKNACKYHGLDESLIAPMTVKGVRKPLGVWDYEETYSRFKTLGAKRYMVEREDGTISMTVSGLNKRTVIPYMQEKLKSNDSIFDAFKDGLYIPPKYTGKNTHTYIDEPCVGIVKDYRGEKYAYSERSIVHLEETDYHMSLASEYIKYLMGVRHYE